MTWRSKSVASVFARRADALANAGTAVAPALGIRRIERILRHVARTAVKSRRGWHGIGDGGMTVLLDHAMPWAPVSVRYFDAGAQRIVAAPQWLMMGPSLDIVFGVSNDWTLATGPIDPTFYLLPGQIAAKELSALYRMAYVTLRQLANIADPLPFVVEKEEIDEPKPGDDHVK